MPNLRLTRRAIDDIPFSASGQILYRDTLLSGFGLRVGSRAGTTWNARCCLWGDIGSGMFVTSRCTRCAHALVPQSAPLAPSRRRGDCRRGVSCSPRGTTSSLLGTLPAAPLCADWMPG